MEAATPQQHGSCEASNGYRSSAPAGSSPPPSSKPSSWPVPRRTRRASTCFQVVYGTGSCWSLASPYLSFNSSVIRSSAEGRRLIPLLQVLTIWAIVVSEQLWAQYTIFRALLVKLASEWTGTLDTSALASLAQPYNTFLRSADRFRTSVHILSARYSAN